ncbi:beta strand repeat-containing protein, partial [Campylobacter upsaliensis]|uniref:beta strand repeat-containing protein n=1 Tax=Campylobacter upsaliensis TaxID=28080 RepID=UPI0022EA72FF
MQQFQPNSHTRGGGDTMLSCNQQEIQNLPQSRLNSHSFKSRLIPSFLALSVISALYSPLQANWVHNKPDGSSENGNNLTITNGGTVNNKNWIFYTSGNSAGTLTINAKLSASGSSGAGGGVSVSRNTRVNGITIGSNGGITVADNNKQSIRNEGTITTFTNSGTIDKGYMLNLGTVENFTNSGFINDLSNSERISSLTNSGTIDQIINQDGFMNGTINNTGTINTIWITNYYAGQQSTMSNFTNTGNIGTIYVHGLISTLELTHNTGSVGSINNNGLTTINGTGTITTLNQNRGTSTLNKGTITTLNQNGGSTTINNNAKVSTLHNRGGSLTNQGGTISTLNNMNTITNQSGTITTLNNSANVMNTGGTITTLNNNNANASVTNQSGTIATLTNTSGRVMNTGGTITMLNNNGSGNVMNTGGTITMLNNTGGNVNNQSGTISTLNNSANVMNTSGGAITTLNNTSANAKVNNQGSITTLTSTGGSLNNIQGTIENLKITSGDFELNNMQQGRIANIEIAGNGKININDNMNIGYNKGISTFRIASGATPTLNFGEVRTATTAQETYATVKLVDTNNANTTQARVAIDKLTIALVGEDTQIGKSVSLANSVSGAANSGVGNVYVKSADFSQDLKQSGFYGTFNAQTQTIDTRFNANLGA